MQGSALVDEAAFARKVEAAYLQMFERWRFARSGPAAEWNPST
jgi:hypothetical protein